MIQQEAIIQEYLQRRSRDMNLNKEKNVNNFINIWFFL